MGTTSLTAVARARAERGLTQAELAELVGASRKTITRNEAGTSTPRLPLAARLAHELGLTLDDLIEGVA
jgi:putative transcriptional regulator